MNIKKIWFMAAVFLCVACSSNRIDYDYLQKRDFFQGRKLSNSSVPYFYYGDMGMWEHLYKMSQAFVVPNNPPKAIIIPHHDITVSQQNSFYKALSQLMDPDLVVLVCPDHYEQGKNFINIPTKVQFESPDRIVETDTEFAKTLLSSDLKDKIHRDNKLWFKEHGVFVHTPFIGHYFPNAKILPIALKPESIDEECTTYKELADFLYKNLSENSLVIASVDFSHYQIPSMTNIHDEKSLHTIANMEELSTIEVDSPESLTLVTEYARLKGCHPALIHRTSTFDYIPDPNIVSTSHQYWGFYDSNDAIAKYKTQVAATDQRYSFIDYENTLNQTLLICGSGKLDFGVRTKIAWDRYNKSTDPGVLNTKYFAGEEARFLKGFDAYIFDANTVQDKILTRVLSEKMHKTYLTIDSVEVENVSEKNLQEILKQVDSKNAAKVLVVSNNFSQGKEAEQKLLLSTNYMEDFYKKYNIVILRDNTGTTETYVYIRDGKQRFVLGQMNPEKNIYSLLSVVFRNGKIRCMEWNNPGNQTLD